MKREAQRCRVLKTTCARHPDVREANARFLQRVSRTEGPCASIRKLNARSLTPISTPAHEARAGDPGSAAEENAASLTGFRMTMLLKGAAFRLCHTRNAYFRYWSGTVCSLSSPSQKMVRIHQRLPSLNS